MPRLLTILLALAVAAPGCLCPLLHGTGCGHQHDHEGDGRAPVCCFAPPDCPHSHVVCDHEDPMAPRAGAPGMEVTPDSAASPALSLEAAEALPRPQCSAPISRGPPTSAGAAGREARILFHSFLL